jgi:hypothetical protein
MTHYTELSNKQNDKIMAEMELSEIDKYIVEMTDRFSKVILSAIDKEQVKAFGLITSGELTISQEFQLGKIVLYLKLLTMSVESNINTLDLFLSTPFCLFPCEDN